MMETSLHVLFRSFESVQWVVSLGEWPVLIFEVDSAAQHLLFFGRISVIDKSSVIIVVLSWLHIGVLNEPPEILGFVLLCVLRKKSLFWLDVVSDWVLLADSFCSCISVRISKKIFADQALNMSGVARYLLIPDLMVWTAHPISCKFAIVTVNLLILINGRYEV